MSSLTIRFSFLILTFVLASKISVAAAINSTCGDKNACLFKWYDNSGMNSYSWNLCKLCKPAGSEYRYIDKYNHSFVFNIGNIVSATYACYPPWSTSVAQGILNLFWGNSPKCPNPPDGTCYDPVSKKPVCCTADCVAIGTLTPDNLFPYITPFIDNTTQKINGITLFYRGTSPDASDPFACPTDPTTGCSGIRTVTINLVCDRKGSTNNLTNITVTEPKPCSYTLNALTKAACSKVGVVTVDEL